MNTGFNLGEPAARGGQKFHGLLLEHELSELRLVIERKAGVLLDQPFDQCPGLTYSSETTDQHH